MAIKKATLYGANNEAKVVDVGSADASALQSQGWGLTPGSFKAPVIAPAPIVEAPAVDPLQTLAKTAGESGLGIDEYTKLANVNSNLSQEEQDKIQSDLGINDVENKTFALPSQSTEQLYNAKYGELGLADLKTKIADYEAQITSKKNALNQAIGKVSENPWLDEASRIGRVKRLTELANADIANVTDQYTNLKDLYNSGVNEINNYITRTSNDFANEKANNAAKLNYLTTKAENQIKNAQADKTSKVYRYIPDYLTGVNSANTAKASDDLALKGYTYVATPAERDKLRAQGYEIITQNGRTYAKPGELSIYEAKKKIDAQYKTGGGGGQAVDQEIETLAKDYNNGGKLGNIGAVKKAKVLQRAEELKKEEAMASRPTTAEAVQKIIKGALEEGYNEIDIINSLVEDFGFKKDVATRLVNINK